MSVFTATQRGVGSVRLIVLIVRSVAMGIMHEKIFVQSILRHYQSDNARLNAILDQYRQHATLRDFGAISASMDCSRAIDILRPLAPDYPLSEAQQGHLQRLKTLSASVLPDQRFIQNIFQATPPFDIMVYLRQAIDALVEGAKEAGCSQVGTDELLPLIAYALVQSGMRNTKSLFLYARNFTQSSLGPEFECAVFALLCLILQGRVVDSCLCFADGHWPPLKQRQTSCWKIL